MGKLGNGCRGPLTLGSHSLPAAFSVTFSNPITLSFPFTAQFHIPSRQNLICLPPISRAAFSFTSLRRAEHDVSFVSFFPSSFLPSIPRSERYYLRGLKRLQLVTSTASPQNISPGPVCVFFLCYPRILHIENCFTSGLPRVFVLVPAESAFLF